jgi:hypothetical protein
VTLVTRPTAECRKPKALGQAGLDSLCLPQYDSGVPVVSCPTEVSMAKCGSKCGAAKKAAAPKKKAAK